MKNLLHNQTKQSKKRSHPSFREYDESHHLARIIKTHAQKKANNVIDKALRRNNLKDIYDMDDYY